MASAASDFIGTKCPRRLKGRVRKASKGARVTESELLRVALEETLDKFPEYEALREVVLKWRRKHEAEGNAQ